MNVERFREVVEFLKENRDLHDQAQWLAAVSDPDHYPWVERDEDGKLVPTDYVAQCHTVGCIAGWTSALFGEGRQYLWRGSDDVGWDASLVDGTAVETISEFAAELLDLERWERDWLFDGSLQWDSIVDAAENGEIPRPYWVDEDEDEDEEDYEDEYAE
jgi:hypothetical protein